MPAQLHIKLPKGFEPERIYIVKLIFENFLGFTIQLTTHVENHYAILLPNQNKLLIYDQFINTFNDVLPGYEEKFLPKPPRGATSFPEDEKGCLVLYGEPVIQRLSKENATEIHWRNDIFAASFLMLTRWEEIVFSGDKDEYSRFPEEKHLSVQYSFSHRPIVNEFLEATGSFLQELGLELPETNRNYTVYPEHDVDYFERYPDFPSWIQTLSADLIRRKSFSLALESLKGGYAKLFAKGADPFDTFDFLMNESEKIGVKSTFYFMPGKGIKGDEYELFSAKIRSRMTQILENGHQIAMHPGFNTAFDADLMEIEYSRIKRIHPEINTSRQHYLQLNLPYHYRQLNQLGVKVDTSLGFKDRNGFRNSCCFAYPYFDPIDRKELKLTISSFALMDTVFLRRKWNVEEISKEFSRYATIISKYKGDFRFIWHNSNFNLPEWRIMSAKYSDYLYETCKDQ